MTFAVFVPPQAISEPCPVLWYLSGLTCTHANVMEKGEYRRMAAELGLIVVCPDTSPRGNDVPDELTNWQMGKGAGFYLDATEEPWSENYRMYTYITEELPAYRQPALSHGHEPPGHFRPLHGRPRRHDHRPQEPGTFQELLRLRADRRTFDGRLVGACAWKNISVPIAPPGGKYDACALVSDGARFPEFLIDQGKADGFPKMACGRGSSRRLSKTGIKLTLRMHERYDHSYYFISSFMDDHLKWHAERLA
jgi:S-formylglutathione hydrolase